MNERASQYKLPWLAISVALHAIVFALLYLFTPLREFVFPERQPGRPEAASVSRRQIMQVQEEIEEHIEMKMRQRLREMEEIKHVMHQVERTKDQAYQEMARGLSQDAVQVALEEMARSMQLQQQCISDQRTQANDLAVSIGEIDTYLQANSEFAPEEPKE